MLWSVIEVIYLLCFFFFKQKTAYELRISDWSSDVGSSDLTGGRWISCGLRWGMFLGVAVTLLRPARGRRARRSAAGHPPRRPVLPGHRPAARSEERRVGKEC